MRITLILLITLLSTSCSDTIKLPRPTGKLAVGVKYLSFVDSSRQEILTDDPNDFREITAKVWYPADFRPDSRFAPYIENFEKLSKEIDLNPNYKEVQTNSHLDLKIHHDVYKFPVLIFSHGWGEFNSQLSSLFEDLASHGYVVFSISHHFECKYFNYPDGDFHVFDPAGKKLQEILSQLNDPKAIKMADDYQKMKTDSERKKFLKAVTAKLPLILENSSNIWAEDIIFTLDKVSELDKMDSFFKNKLDASRIGVFGMSLGGLASGVAAIKDSRIKAVVNLDGGIYGDWLDKKLYSPVMFINSDRYLGYHDYFFSQCMRKAYSLNIKNSNHMNYHDLSIIDPKSNHLGEIDGNMVIEIIRNTTLTFFDVYLKKQNPNTLTFLKNNYPELIFNSN